MKTNNTYQLEVAHDTKLVHEKMKTKKMFIGFAMSMALLASVAVYANGHHDGNRVGSGALSLSTTEQNSDLRFVRDVGLYIYNANTSKYVYLQILLSAKVQRS